MDPNTRVNSAAAALGVSGAATSRWDIDSLVDRSIERYNEQEKQAATAKDSGNEITARLHHAVACENARFLAGYYQHHGLGDLYSTWSRREMRAYLQAFNPPNVIAEAIQGGRATDNYVREEDEDDAVLNSLFTAVSDGRGDDEEDDDDEEYETEDDTDTED